MRGLRHVTSIGAVLALLLPYHPAGAAGPDFSHDFASRYTAQYDGPAYGYGPQGDGLEDYGPQAFGSPVGDVYGPRQRYAGPYRQGGDSRAGGSVYYHGYRIRLAAPAATAQGAGELAEARRQIAIVERAGLSGAAQQLFHKNPIEFGQRGHFTREAVFLGPQAGSKPVLLHEYMHVYHRDRLPGGFANPAVQAFYQQAVASGAYPAGSYMLSNVKEFFAMTASCFLNGSVARPPYTRAAIRSAQPAYYAYLSQLFGRGG